jgi:hypothetical protein
VEEEYLNADMNLAEIRGKTVKGNHRCYELKYGQKMQLSNIRTQKGTGMRRIRDLGDQIDRTYKKNALGAHEGKSIAGIHIKEVRVYCVSAKYFSFSSMKDKLSKIIKTNLLRSLK